MNFTRFAGIFKVWKSIYHVDKLKKVKIERFECQLYGKLILILILFCVYTN